MKEGRPSSLRVAIGQMNARLGDVDGNIREAVRLSSLAAAEGARLIILPEGCLTGNAIGSPAQQETLSLEPGPFRPLCECAADHGIAICAGFAAVFGEKFNIVHAIVESSRRVLFQRKAFRATTEPEFLAPWPDPARTMFNVDGARVAIVICSEMGVKPVMDDLARRAPDIVLHPSAGHMNEQELLRSGRPSTPEARAFEMNCRRVVERAAQRVKERGIPLLGANPVGYDGATWWPGNSYGVDAGGTVRLWLKGENRPERMENAFAVGTMPFIQAP